MIIIDGSKGEGGGQVLRTSLGLSVLTGQAFRIENIRARRNKPGLMRQHLTAVCAAAQISGANVAGDAIGSKSLTFEPGTVKPGRYEFAVGTAGSATLVLQTVLPALVVAKGPSSLTLNGGTHNSWSPPFDFLAKSFLPLLNRMGARVEAHLVRPGFYPAGGGEFKVEIEPAPGGRLQPLELMERGEIVCRRARAVVAKLPDHIAGRELKIIGKKLGWDGDSLSVEHAHDSAGPGNIVMLEITSRNVTEVFTAFGEKDVRAEAVAAEAADQARQYLAAGVPVGPYLADQLVVPIAMAGGRFRTIAPTRHTTTNVEVIQRFMDAGITARAAAQDRNVWEIEVRKDRERQ